MDLENEFKAASDRAFKLPSQSNENLLKIYALFKQATEGDVSGSRPGLLNLKARAKFDAWSSLSGTPLDEAKRKYIDLIQSLEKQ